MYEWNVKLRMYTDQTLKSHIGGYASPEHHWSTNKRVMLNDVLGSIKFILPRMPHVLSMHLISSVKRKGHQWWTCQFWCSLTNANRAALYYVESTGHAWGRQVLTPAPWSLFLTEWSEKRNTSRLLKGILWLLSSLHNGADTVGFCPSAGHLQGICRSPWDQLLQWVRQKVLPHATDRDKEQNTKLKRN